MKQILEQHFEDVAGAIHCSGGGQTKCMKYLPCNLKVIKDNLFDVPPIFELIRQNSGADDREMYQVFNMGHRLEIFTSAAAAASMIQLAAGLGIEARIVGRTEAASRKSLHLKAPSGWVVYEY